jgi:predicted HTH domain antitoxin
MGILINIPEPDFEGLGKTETEARLDLAVFFYTNWSMPPGRCAAYAGVSKVVFMDELGKRNIPVRYDLAALEQDLQNWKNFPPTNGSNKRHHLP